MENIMTKNELCNIYVKRNPSFNGNGNITMSANGLKKLFDTTWDTAFYKGEEEDETDHNFQQQSASVDMLRSIFGMK
jgi:hypothetical protein